MNAVNELGRWSAIAVFLIGVAYFITLVIGIAIHGLDEPIVDPVLAVMEVLTLLSAIATVIMMAAIHGYAAAGRKIHGLIALAFTTAFAGVTTVVHFVELTAVRQRGSAGIAWPSAEYAAELLAWNLLLGLALIFASRVFEAGGPGRRVGQLLLVSGVSCVAGTIGPALGDMRLQSIGIFGYAIVLPVACLLLARLFERNGAFVEGR